MILRVQRLHGKSVRSINQVIFLDTPFTVNTNLNVILAMAVMCLHRFPPVACHLSCPAKAVHFGTIGSEGRGCQRQHRGE